MNAIETIQKVHNYDCSNKDSCFKAFVCLALNEKKLVLYLKQVLKTTVIIENYYQTWSYVKTTGFDDALKSLDQLKIVKLVAKDPQWALAEHRGKQGYVALNYVKPKSVTMP